MINKDKKRKLREVLKKISPEDKTDILFDALQEEILSINDRFSEIKDYSPDIEQIKSSLEDMRDAFVERIENTADKNSIEELKNFEFPKTKNRDERTGKNKMLLVVKTIFSTYLST